MRRIVVVVFTPVTITGPTTGHNLGASAPTKAMEVGTVRAVEVLLIEDNPGDVRLTREALAAASVEIRLTVLNDGEQAIAYLRRPGARPDLILLDLNLPRVDGGDVLAAIKVDARLRAIPVVVLTSSEAPRDIARVYDLHANCCVTKPLELDRYIEAVRAVAEFWLTRVVLP